MAKKQKKPAAQKPKTNSATKPAPKADSKAKPQKTELIADIAAAETIEQAAPADAKPANAEAKAPKKEKTKKDKSATLNDTGYLWSMSYAQKIDQPTHWFQMLVIAFFGACVIMITHMHSYERNMAQFYWSGGNGNLSDFFSFNKMIAILVCAALALTILLYRLCTQSLAIKKSYAYIPMIIYSLMVVISYFCSDYKEFALLGYNDRFEGTLTLLAYMVMLFFTINSVNTESNVKWVVYSIAVTSAMLGILGVTQALDMDFFRTALGQKMIVPNGTVEMNDAFLRTSFGAALNEAGLIQQSTYTVNQLISMGKSIGVNYLNFTFQNREIYQTVYNINYVSFYLTLLVPLFGMLFIRSVELGKEEKIWKKILWGALFALLVFNLIGSASSGGLIGMAAVVLVALILLNKKILKWWKPVLVLIIIAAIVFGATFDRWGGEVKNAVNGVTGANNVQTETTDTENETPVYKLQYIDTDEFDVYIGVGDNEIHLTMYPDAPEQIRVLDQDGVAIEMARTNVGDILAFDDERFPNCFLQPAQDEVGNDYYIFTHDKQEHNWAFRITEDGVFFLNNLGELVDMDKIPAVGFENNQSWGSGRGYIFSRTIPMMKDTAFIGKGADTYCLHFPHNDYVGKLNADWNLYMIVDKPHNMYMGAWIGTGGISVLALLALFIIYAIQSSSLYFMNRYENKDFATYAGLGIFLGIIGFLTAALVDDSTVSVMPMFYSLLGTGIAINMLLKRRAQNEEN